MTHDDAFLQAILEAPDDDAPRLVYADWLEDNGQAERAALIRVQCELAGMDADEPRSPHRLGELKARGQELLSEHGKEWAGRLPGLVETWAFRRGFVEWVRLDAPAFLDHAETLLSLAPIRYAELEQPSEEEIARLNASPHLSRLAGVALPFFCYECRDSQLQVLAASPRLLERLDDLSFATCDIGINGLVPVLASPHLRRLRGFHLSPRTLLGDKWLQALAASPAYPTLESLSLSRCDVGRKGVEALARSGRPARLKSLSLGGNRIDNRGAVALAKCPDLAGLEHLDLSNNRIRDAGAAALAVSPHLRKLSLWLYIWGNRISRRGTEPLTIRFGDRVFF
jgi:uncharacterized protein (TIGR02996 family)